MRYDSIPCSVLAAVESCRVFDRHIQSGIDVIYTDVMGGERMKDGGRRSRLAVHCGRMLMILKARCSRTSL